MSLRTRRLFEEPLGEGEEGALVLVGEIHYNEGGMNYFAGRQEARGYYLSLRPEERLPSGITMYKAFSGSKKLIQEASRFSQKTLATLTAPQDEITRLRDHVLSRLALGSRP